MILFMSIHRSSLLLENLRNVFDQMESILEPHRIPIMVHIQNMQKLFIADCQLQKFPVIGLYMIQEMRWNRLFR